MLRSVVLVMFHGTYFVKQGKFFFKDSKPISCQTAGKKPQIYGSPKDMEVHNCLCFAENGIVDKVR